MATTYRQLLNQVLVALSEDEIPDSQAEITTKYHKLLGLFVNQIKEIVEDEHNWRSLRSTESVTVLAGTSSIAITGANDRSRLLRVHDEINGLIRPLCFNVTDTNAPYALKEMDLSELLRRRSLDVSNEGKPVFFAVDNTGEDAMSLQVHPTTSANADIDITMVIPQPLFANDDLDVNIKVPSRPIATGASWYALEERGEELGVGGRFNEVIFDQVLSGAVMRDSAEQGEYQLVPV